MNEDPRELAVEYGLSLAYAYAVIRGESHRARVVVTFDDSTFLRLHAAAQERTTDVEDLCGRLLVEAAAGL